jgi:hypothetical protein
MSMRVDFSMTSSLASRTTINSKQFDIKISLMLIFVLICLRGQCQAPPVDIDQQFTFQVIREQLVIERLKAFSRINSAREAGLKKMFTEAGCADHMSELPVRHLKDPNLVCVLPGKSNRTIVVGAHFDHVDVGDGVVDNWSGAALLPSLYQSLRGRPVVHTFIFVAFAGEEQGLVGSKGYINSLSKEAVNSTSAMINLECLGVGPSKVWLSHSDRLLAGAFFNLADAIKVPAGVMNVERVGSSDSEPFAERKIARITIHSLTQETWPILHSARDKLDAIVPADYYATYRLLAGYLSLLDAGLEAAGERPSPAPSAK